MQRSVYLQLVGRQSEQYAFLKFNFHFVSYFVDIVLFKL